MGPSLAICRQRTSSVGMPIISARFSSTVSTEHTNLEELVSNLKSDLRAIYFSKHIAPKGKADQLRGKLRQLLYCMAGSEFSKNELPFINRIVHAIDRESDPMDVFTAQEMLALLGAAVPAITAEEVKNIDFFPRFYTSLRGSKEYQQDRNIRLQLFELFLNYVLVSNKPNIAIRAIEAFIEEEASLRRDDVKMDVVDIALEAFATVTPDTATVVKLFEICDLGDEKRSEKLLGTFFIAADAEIGRDYEDNQVAARLTEVVAVLEHKKDQPLNEYINLLFFATKNKFNGCVKEILDRLVSLTECFRNKLGKKIRDEELAAIVSAALKLGHSKAAESLLENLEYEFVEFTRHEWLSYMQIKVYRAADERSVIDMIRKINYDLEHTYKKDFRVNDTATLNYVVGACCYSEKSLDFVKAITDFFESEYTVTPTAETYAALIEHQLDVGKCKEALELFEGSLEQPIEWGEEENSIFAPVLFRLLEMYSRNSDDDVTLKVILYKRIKNYGYSLNKAALRAMIDMFLEQDCAGDAMELFHREVVEHSKDERQSVTKYEPIFESFYEYSTTAEASTTRNWHVYEFLHENFIIPYDKYYRLMEYFISHNEPRRALKMFANLKALSKEAKIAPPNEDVYIYLFRSFARCKFVEGVQKLHLGAKMDLAINMDIRLLNAIMEGYCAIEDSFKVRDAFHIAYSLPKSRGLNAESCYWMLRSLRGYTLKHVTDFYTSLSAYDVLADPRIFGEYLIAHCSFGKYETALRVLEENFHSDGGHLIDRRVLRDMYNWCVDRDVRTNFERFATRHYPALWLELKQSGELSSTENEPLDEGYNPERPLLM
ncbi:uncharacterized protein OGAPODRAFT_14904 [Ogataea polymorpha]|uniref:uncharacterized protein n=1 Tax=Ogataea polymorpha TaxID=460523 RepID=UPI0007F4A421|nr:uncharacterized protein OGAPODRAFT_14904 [Ogataea polymorpha]OBA13895.1 hypothetical protein OGAPODRAFT_14904 [Ogataea polymorpha]